MWWENDISKCPGNDCPMKEQCYRYTVKPDRFQSYSDFTQDLNSEEKCKFFISNEDEKA